MKDRLKKTWKIVVLILLVITTFSYGMFQGGFVSWFLFYSFMPFALYALLLAFYPMNKLEVKRMIEQVHFRAGESIRVQLTIHRNYPFPLFFLYMKDDLSGRLHVDKAAPFVFPGFRKQIIVTYEIPHLPRGEHTLHGVYIKTTDLLGFIEKEHYVELLEKILVYPHYEELQYHSLVHQFDQGQAASKERIQRDTSMAVGIREYQPGDRLSWINWKATARRNDIMIKEFEQRQSHDVMVILDCAPDERFEISVSFAASFIKAMIKRGSQVGLLTSGIERLSLPVRGGEEHQHQMYYRLAKVEDNSPVSLDRFVETESASCRQNTNIVLITTKLTSGLIEQIRGSLQRGSATVFLMKKRQDVMTDEEKTLRSSAQARGIHVLIVREGAFRDAFSEVSSG